MENKKFSNTPALAVYTELLLLNPRSLRTHRVEKCLRRGPRRQVETGSFLKVPRVKILGPPDVPFTSASLHLNQCLLSRLCGRGQDAARATMAAVTPCSRVHLRTWTSPVVDRGSLAPVSRFDVLFNQKAIYSLSEGGLIFSFFCLSSLGNLIPSRTSPACR